MNSRRGKIAKARISVRDISGQTAAEYIDEPGSEGMSLEREFVYGFGRLLVERHPSAPTPDHAASSSLFDGGSYSLDLTDGGGEVSGWPFLQLPRLPSLEPMTPSIPPVEPLWPYGDSVLDARDTELGYDWGEWFKCVLEHSP